MEMWSQVKRDHQSHVTGSHRTAQPLVVHNALITYLEKFTPKKETEETKKM